MKKPTHLHASVRDVFCFFFITVLFVLFSVGCKKENFPSLSLKSASSAFSEISGKPNIILILGDDIGYEIPTCDGGGSYSTPNIDEISANGIRFTQCHASPKCSPSRFMLLTGKYNFRNYTEWGIMDKNERTVSDLLQDAGYKTYVGGKWQFDGGDKSIHSLGFDDYIVYLPFARGNSEEDGSRYKNPHLYVNGEFLPDSLTLNKYGEDIVCDSIIHFMARNADCGQSFFVYYPMMLCHSPFSPTPDDVEFATWDPTVNKSNVNFFPSMVKYMDKKIGQVVHAVDSLGIAENTVILYIGDNGSPEHISSMFNGYEITGGKGLTTEYGTHVPMFVYEPGFITPGINDDLIDFTDFLPTIAGIADAGIPNNFKTIDGVSFFPRLAGETGERRSSIYCYYAPEADDIPVEWAQDVTYKYYGDGRFYNIVSDIQEEGPIPDSSLTTDEMLIKQQLFEVIDDMHK